MIAENDGRSGDDVRSVEKSGDDVISKEKFGDNVKPMEKSGDDVKSVEKSGDDVKADAIVSSTCSKPGSARFGNFINYYSFNPAERRIRLIPEEAVDQLTRALLQSSSTEDRELVMLDVGCNAGELTCAIYKHFSRDHYKLHMLGIDVDETLVERSKEMNTHPQSISFLMADVTRGCDIAKVERYLGERKHDVFDVTFCFSVTLWIHINHGDNGLKAFLKFLSSKSKYILIEPQPWKCYKTAMRRMSKLGCDKFEHFTRLEWRQDVVRCIEEYLVGECNCVLQQRLGTTEWDRNLCLFATPDAKLIQNNQ